MESEHPLIDDAWKTMLNLMVPVTTFRFTMEHYSLSVVLTALACFSALYLETKFIMAETGKASVQLVQKIAFIALVAWSLALCNWLLMSESEYGLAIFAALWLTAIYIFHIGLQHLDNV